MKCNKFYEYQCCTSCFKRDGTENTECPSYTLHIIFFFQLATQSLSWICMPLISHNTKKMNSTKMYTPFKIGLN